MHVVDFAAAAAAIMAVGGVVSVVAAVAADGAAVSPGVVAAAEKPLRRLAAEALHAADAAVQPDLVVANSQLA